MPTSLEHPRRTQAAADVAAVQWHYTQRGVSLATAALAGAARYQEWVHHPHDDLVDPASAARCFYHAHAAAERAADEHGHFHVFAPAPAECRPDFVHLVGISLNAQGLPTRLFTTNRWVTGEHWLPATTLIEQLPQFTLQTRGRLAPVARWVQGMVHLYADLLADLLHERDAVLHARAAGHADGAAPDAPDRPGAAVLDDRALHVVSERPVALLERLARHGSAPATPNLLSVC